MIDIWSHMIYDPLLLERLRLAAIVCDALNSIGLAHAALGRLAPDDPQRPQWQKVVLASAELAELVGDRLLALGRAPDVDSASRH
jgi:hypothetical protein